MIDRYRPGDLRAISAFARAQPEFDYLKAIIRAHTVERAPGGVYVWREAETRDKGRRTAAAVCGLAYLNRDDAWLYGMRVDDRSKGKGIATELTRELMRIAARSGRTWIALDTMNTSMKAPVFRITEKLGMKLMVLHATSLFWNLPPGDTPRTSAARDCIPGRRADVFLAWQQLGVKVFLREHFPRWLWSRLLPGVENDVNRHGRLVEGALLHITAHAQRTVINWFDLSVDPEPVLAALLARARGKGRTLVINHPAEWTPLILRLARRLVPELRLKQNYDSVCWRIYGKRLHG